MVAPDRILDYSEPRKSRATAAVVLIYTAFLTGLLYLVFSQAGSDAPLRIQASPPKRFADIEAQLKAVDDDAHNAEMCVVLLQPPTHQIARRLTASYYAAQYLRYPRRVFVGTDVQIINNEDQFLSVAQSTPRDWMRQHQVGSIYVVYDVGLGPQLEVHAAR